ncbi:M23 family metallopeptidase [Jannaschia seohaensis]|uniref:Peptidase M23-like protein n=1 Tax=Jannaschia seohaensis TaxID=475081 RepID=A0A2Y9AJH9_9RHOB|nr:M23 family metallopeptidase [Jannaschia seohaensis]PWJ20279.1 peptidase M23-like protein [Jannaschia seohaensis]SSA44295.1 Peptidase family M23 [Jannaschia seohaensis]
MTATILLFQITLPLALLGWIFFLPSGSAMGLALQIAGVGAFLFALARVAQWALPVWWLPWVYGALWLVGAVMLVAFRPGLAGLSVWPSGWGWLSAALGGALLAAGLWFGAQALSGRSSPPVEVVEIGTPFARGQFLVASGGSHPIVNAHMRTLDESVARFRPWRGQSYAVDFFGLGPWGLRAQGWRPAEPEAYAIFGAPLVAPCAGTVVAAEGDRPDFDVPQEDPVNRLGNHIILRCGTAEIVLAHMRQGSVAVRPGDRVQQGQPLGQVGNSGASTEPHLHIHAQQPAEAGAPLISGEPLGLRIDGRILVRGDRIGGADG